MRDGWRHAATARRWGAGLFAFLGAALLPTASCSFSVDANGFEDGTCPTTMKACNNQCVDAGEPSTGCGFTGCSPCDLDNAIAGCLDFTCVITGCTGPTLMDCDNNAKTGCEVDVAYDPRNCGACGCRCGTGDSTDCLGPQDVEQVIHGSPGCSQGLCTVGQCDPGWGDCDNVLTDSGCETDLTTPLNCGYCGNKCPGACQCDCTAFGDAGACGCVDPDGGLCGAGDAGDD